MITKKYILTALVVFIPALVSAQTIRADQYVLWGIGNDEINIPAGSVITEAVLTIQNVAPSNTPLYVHLLDNTNKGTEIGTDIGAGDVFKSYGQILPGTYENGNYVCRFSQIENPQSPIRSVFTAPTTIVLADSTPVQLSSTLLELIDYVGNGRGFGIGIDSDNSAIQYSSIALDLNIKAYTQTGMSKTLSFYSSYELVNNDFESGDKGWTEHPGWSIVNDPTNAYSGSYCAKFVSSQNYSGNFAIFQTVAVKAQTYYNVSGQIRNNHGKDMRYLVWMLDSAGNNLQYCYTSSVTSSSYMESSGLFKTPAGCTALRIMLYIHDVQANDGTIAYADNCVLEDMNDASVNSMALNAGYELGDKGWTEHPGWSIVNDPANAYSGSYCAKFVSSQNYSGNFAIFQTVAVKAQTYYNVSGQIRNNHGKDMRYLVWMLDSAGNNLQYCYTSSVTSSSYMESSGLFKTPAGCTALRIMLYIHDVQANDGTIAYADNCVLEDMNDASVNSMALNAGYELGDKGWTEHPGWSIVNDPANAYSGSYCAKFVSSQNYSGNFAIFQTVAVKAQTYYNVSGQIRNNHGKDMRYLVWMLDSAGNNLQYCYTSSVTSSSYMESSGLFKTPAGCTALRIMLYIHDVQANDGTIAYADNCVLEDMNDASVNSMALNAGYELGDKGWTEHPGWSIVNDPANAYSGSYCAKFVSSQNYSGNFAIFQTVAVKAQTYYNVSGQIRNNHGKDMRYLVWMLDSAGNNLQYCYTSSVTSSSYMESSGLFKTPAGCTALRIMLYIHDVQANDGTIAYADNCVLEEK